LWTTGKALTNLFFLLQVIFPSASNRQVRSSTYSNIFKGFHIEKEIIYALEIMITRNYRKNGRNYKVGNIYVADHKKRRVLLSLRGNSLLKVE
jgi:hypothetical protein